MMFLYTVFVTLVYMLTYPYTRLQAALGKQAWQGRLGLIEPVGPKDIWMHAASVGEVKVLNHLIDFLKEHSPKIAIHLTVMTPAGFATVNNLVRANHPDVSVSFFPFDVPFVVSRTFDKIRPRMVVVAETEIWFNTIFHAAKRNVPVILVNGRMSEKSFMRYLLIRPLLTRLFHTYDRFFFKTEEDFRRYQKFGVTTEKGTVAGDMKFDAPLLPRSAERRRELRARLGIADEEFLIIAGSTRQGEHAVFAEIYKKLVSVHPQVRLAIAPRHLERVGEVMFIFKQKDIPFTVYSRLDTAGKEVIIIDKMGLLNELYLAADIAFVGGTLVARGGHNILEPVWAGTPVLFGPSIENVVEAARYIEAHNYGKMVASKEELLTTVRQLIEGTLTFAIKTEKDWQTSPTAHIGEYILKKLEDA